MSRYAIDLKAWKPKTGARKYETFFQKEEESPKCPATQALRDIERHIRQPSFDPLLEPDKGWNPEITPATNGPVARCRLVKYSGDVAECVVLLDGIELPNVGFPASVLHQKGVELGGRFHWIMRDGSRIRVADIDVNVPQTDEMTADERKNLDRLYDEFKKGRAEDGGIWPEFSGPGL